MALSDTLTSEIENILETSWKTRDGNVIPDSDSIGLKDEAVKIEAAFLYADLAGSSNLAQVCPWQTTAKIIKAYLNCCTRLIKAHSGEIRSFDGDRVMGVFKEGSKINNAVECARKIDWFVEKILNPKVKEKFKSVRENNIQIKHCIGVDSGDAVAVRTGIRNSNDLIWIGQAPSFAAKLSDIRAYPYSVYITQACYKVLFDSNKLVASSDVWEPRTFTFAGKERTVYRTSYMLSI